MYQTIKCIEPDCKRLFNLSQKDLDFYKEKNYALPKRCLDCRKRKRTESTSPFGAIAKDMRFQIGQKGRHYKPSNKDNK